MIRIALILFLILPSACSNAHSAGHGHTAPGFEVEVEVSFREMGVRKTRVIVHAVPGATYLDSIRGSEGIRLPDFPETIHVVQSLIFEVQWLGDVRAGTLVFKPVEGDELKLALVYGDGHHESPTAARNSR